MTVGNERYHPDNKKIVPLFSHYGEESIIGAMIENPDLIDELEIPPGLFAIEACRDIYSALKNLTAASASQDWKLSIDFAVICSAIEAVGLTHITPDYLLSVKQEATSRPEQILQVLIDRKKRRDLSSYSLQVRKMIDDEGSELTADQMIARAEQSMLRLVEPPAGKDEQGTIMNALPDLMDHIVETQDARASGKMLGASFGLGCLDGPINGVMAGDLVVIGARPSMGKTALALGAAKATVKQGKRVVVFSYEMPRVKLLSRLVSDYGNINSRKIKTGDLSESDIKTLSLASQKMAAELGGLIVHDDTSIDLAMIGSLARKEARKGELGLVIIDHLGLMQETGFRPADNQAMLSYITRESKKLAMRLGVPVMLLCQLNRSLENRDNKRPIMSDLRGSGTIEQDADMIGFLYREYVYDDTADPNHSEIIFRKVRDGSEPFTAYARFYGQYSRFEDPPMGYNPNVFTAQGIMNPRKAPGII